MDIKC